jgi:hypothetical protein
MLFTQYGFSQFSGLALLDKVALSGGRGVEGLLGIGSGVVIGVNG